MHRPIPTNIIVEMNKKGFSDVDIMRYLKEKGYTPVEVSDAFNQAKIKLELSKRSMERDELLDEGIKVSEDTEKEDMSSENNPQQITSSQIQALNQLQSQLTRYADFRISKIEEKHNLHEKEFADVIKEISGKIKEQSDAIKILNAEMHSLHQSFSKILEPLAHNVKTMSGMLDMKKEEEKAEKVEKEIKKEEKTIKEEEKEIRNIEKKTKRPKTKPQSGKKIIKKTTITTTETSESKKGFKRNKRDPSIEDIF